MKVIEVEMCGYQCPYFKFPPGRFIYCCSKYQSKRIPDAVIKSKSDFPDWCPLPDAPKGIRR